MPPLHMIALGPYHVPSQEVGRFIKQTIDKLHGWLVGWLGFNGILSTQVAAISCLRKFKVC